MATAYEIADLLTQGLQGPTGADDSGWHVGQIISWSSTTGLNSVRINGATLTNLKALTPSIGTEYAPGQTVLIVRKQTQYFILGPVTTPGSVGSTPPTQIDAGGGTISGTAGTWRDLDGGASLSPSFTVKLGPLQRCLLMWGASYVRAWGCGVEGSITLTSPGGGNILANPGGTLGQKYTVENQISLSNYVSAPASKTFFLQANTADASPSTSLAMPGNNVVAIKYRFTVLAGAAGAGTPTASVFNPWILAIPF
jgi:hypothetical protein